MNGQGGLFETENPLKPWQRRDLAARATEKREEAVARVVNHADQTIRVELLACVRATAIRNPMLTSEDVRLAYHGAEPHEPRLLGAVMREAKAKGWIVPTDDWRLSIRPECHRRPQRVWRSLVFGVAE